MGSETQHTIAEFGTVITLQDILGFTSVKVLSVWHLLVLPQLLWVSLTICVSKHVDPEDPDLVCECFKVAENRLYIIIKLFKVISFSLTMHCIENQSTRKTRKPQKLCLALLCNVEVIQWSQVHVSAVLALGCKTKPE